MIGNEGILFRRGELLKTEEDPRRKKTFFDSVVWQIFDRCKPIPGGNDITISGYVLADGRGDHVHMQKMVKMLHKKFPDRKINLITYAAENHKNNLKPCDIANCKEDIKYLGEGRGNFDLPKIELSEEQIELIKNSGVWITGPISFVVSQNLVSIAKEKGVALHEYDLTSNIAAAGSFGTEIQMGIGNKGKFFAEGIFIPKSKESKWENLSNDEIKNILFETKSPKKEEIEKYLSERQIFFSYMSKNFYVMNFIQDALVFSQKDKPIDLCIINKQDLLGNLDELKETVTKSDNNIKSIKLISLKTGREETIEIASQGRELRIIDIKGVTKKDFKLLTSLSEPLIGCTGDHSFAQAISSGKIPCFEYPRHKSDFYRNYSYLAHEKFSNNPVLYNYVVKKIDELSTQVKTITPEEKSALIEQAHELASMIREKFAFNHTFTGMVNEKLCCQADQDIKNLKASLEEQFVKGEKTIEQVEEELKNILREKELLIS